ncbi:MAG: radical SAM protein [Desulfonauticus sp.]|nr:radical SAM protein [Desulfonauticus sp.]
MKYVFGPVNSSRLGRSLGIDLLAKKICSFDCLYCEVGKTVIKTLKRDIYVDPEPILQELEQWFKSGYIVPDVITFGGSGEPCLNACLGFLAKEIKKRYNFPLALLTNSSLLTDENIFSELEPFNFILPSLDSLVQEEFVKINRPVQGLGVKEIKQGLLNLKKFFNGKIFLEIFLLPHVNDSKTNLALLKEFIVKFNPDRVDVVTLTRPGTYVHQAAPKQTLSLWKNELNIKKQSQPNFNSKKQKNKVNLHYNLSLKEIQSLVLSSLARRPQTKEDLSKALGLSLKQVEEAINELEQKKQIVIQGEEDKNSFYRIRK